MTAIQDRTDDSAPLMYVEGKLDEAIYGAIARDRFRVKKAEVLTNRELLTGRKAVVLQVNRSNGSAVGAIDRDFDPHPVSTLCMGRDCMADCDIACCQILAAERQLTKTLQVDLESELAVEFGNALHFALNTGGQRAKALQRAERRAKKFAGYTAAMRYRNHRDPHGSQHGLSFDPLRDNWWSFRSRTNTDTLDSNALWRHIAERSNCKNCPSGICRCCQKGCAWTASDIDWPQERDKVTPFFHGKDYFYFLAASLVTDHFAEHPCAELVTRLSDENGDSASVISALQNWLVKSFEDFAITRIRGGLENRWQLAQLVDVTIDSCNTKRFGRSAISDEVAATPHSSPA